MVANDQDYHWYRQDSNGLWSHKPGQQDVENHDGSYNIIADPELADRSKYTEFIGYYAVTPWNRLFTPSTSNNNASDGVNAEIVF